jgi:hypothetical protein
MRGENPHPSDHDLLLVLDGELPINEADKVRAHLACCWTCRARVTEFDKTIVDFIGVRQQLVPPLPPVDGPQALLRLRLAQLATSSKLKFYERVAAFLQLRAVRLSCSAGFAVLVGLMVWRPFEPLPGTNSRVAGFEIRSVPDPQLTPGATLPLTRDDVCAAEMVDAARVVPVDVAKKVFAAYGLDRPEPRAYEVDYLITPALGGSDSIRNFWPQPYRNTVWNAHIKDALEDHLRHLVCAGQLELARAQHEIAIDWISAYKKYFRTHDPLPEHAAFLKDRPWE